MDKGLLIAEVRKRPLLWKLNSRKDKPSRETLLELWQEVANSMGKKEKEKYVFPKMREKPSFIFKVTVVKEEECRQIWRNLYYTYKSRERRFKRNLARGKPKVEADFKWAYDKQMQFLKPTLRASTSILSEESHEDDESSDSVEIIEVNDNQIDRKITKPNFIANLQNKASSDQRNHMEIPKISESTKVATVTSSVSDNQHNKRSSEQINGMVEWSRDTRNSIETAHINPSSSIDMSCFGDSDYNFLISLLPQLKKMNEFQNLQFRARMTECALKIMYQSSTNID